jgi:hypothetical protein
LTNPRTVLDALKLEAQLSREIGTGPKIVTASSTELATAPRSSPSRWPGRPDRATTAGLGERSDDWLHAEPVAWNSRRRARIACRAQPGFWRRKP